MSDNVRQNKPRTWTLETLLPLKVEGSEWVLAAILEAQPAPFAARKVIELEPVLDLLERIWQAVQHDPDYMVPTAAYKTLEALLREHGRLK